MTASPTSESRATGRRGPAILRIVTAGFTGANADYDFTANDVLTAMGTFLTHNGRRFRHLDVASHPESIHNGTTEVQNGLFGHFARIENKRYISG